jgi:hypothetical protein
MKILLFSVIIPVIAMFVGRILGGWYKEYRDNRRKP